MLPQRTVAPHITAHITGVKRRCESVQVGSVFPESNPGSWIGQFNDITTTVLSIIDSVIMFD